MIKLKNLEFLLGRPDRTISLNKKKDTWDVRRPREWDRDHINEKSFLDQRFQSEERGAVGKKIFLDINLKNIMLKREE